MEVVDDLTQCCLLMQRWREQINSFIMVHFQFIQTIYNK